MELQNKYSAMPFNEQLNNLKKQKKELHSKNLKNINFMIVNLLMQLNKKYIFV